MNLFRNYIMSWWQVGLLKTYVFVVGLIIGSYFADMVSEYYTLLLVVFVVLALYFIHQMFFGVLGCTEVNQSDQTE